MAARIASHHAADPWRPAQAWPATVLVQWGNGVVLSDTPGGSYPTAFFEAFPDGGGFIRGEGKTLEVAEASAFATWERECACAESGGHRWSRTRRAKGGRHFTYTNGGCVCLRCGSFATAMHSVYDLDAWKSPLSVSELHSIANGGCRPDAAPGSSRGGRSSWWRRTWLRAKLAGVRLPEPAPLDPAAGVLEEDDYTTECRRAVAEYLKHNPLPDGASGGMAGVFDTLYRRSLKRLREAAADEDAAC